MNDFLTERRSMKFPSDLLQAWADHIGCNFEDERVQFPDECGWPKDFGFFIAGWNAQASIIEKELVEMTSNGREARIDERVRSKTCICENEKIGGKPFCRKCFTKLPDDLKQRLSNQLVEDFLTAYDEAKTVLKPN